MQNYKVEVKSKEEQLEAVDLFIKLGYERKLGDIPSYLHRFVCTDSSGSILISSIVSGEKQITLPELRAMVSVQKYEELAKKYDGVKTKQLPNGIQFKKSKTSVTIYPSTGTIVSDVNGKINVLKKAGIGKLDYELNKHFSVITPKQKEYLVKTDTGYTLQVLSDVVDGHDGIIEVPEGSNIAWKDNSNGFVFFTKMEMGYRDATVIWQRESLNDQVASAEEYRKSFSGIPKATLDAMNNIQNAFDKAQCAINTQNAMAKLFAYPQYISGVVPGKEFILNPDQKKDESESVNSGQNIVDYLVDSSKSNGFSEGGFIPKSNHGIPAGVVSHGFSSFTQPEELPFVGDELKGVDATLAEREAQYGSFIGVANTTGQLMSVLLNSKNGQTLPYAHQEALHMICSKMARIVNGDHNHLDSWHDICGYAKLIENNIK